MWTTYPELLHNSETARSVKPATFGPIPSNQYTMPHNSTAQTNGKHNTNTQELSIPFYRRTFHRRHSLHHHHHHHPQCSYQNRQRNTQAACWTVHGADDQYGKWQNYPETNQQNFISPQTAGKTREHWIQRITFAAETNAADTHTAWQTDTKQHNIFSAR